MNLDRIRQLVRSERAPGRLGDARRVYRLAAWSARDLDRIATLTADTDPWTAATTLFGGNA